MRVIDFLNKKNVKVGYKTEDKLEIIEELINMVSLDGHVNDRGIFKNDIIKRDEEAPTAIGQGVVIFHAKSEGVSEIGLSALTTEKELSLNSLDGEPSKIFFMIATPIDQSEKHIVLLARLASLLVKKEFCEELKQAVSPGDFLYSIIERENERYSIF